jgi:hydrogenase nickel incorporation protein HypB
MCDSCGCGDRELVPVDLHEKILAGNERTAAHNRQHFRAAGVVAVNVMGSPGAGKTAILEASARALGGDCRLGALAGDLATEHDAERLRAAGIAAESITTGSACHLDAAMVHRALHRFDWRGLDYLFIENVGNLVCPAIYDLGQAANVVALAVTEGVDKPLKYPVMFRMADLVLLTKIDLLPHLPAIRIEEIAANLACVMPRAAWLPVSAVSGEGIAAWHRWLAGIRDAVRTPASAGVASHPYRDELRDGQAEVTASREVSSAPASGTSRGSAPSQ